MKRLIAIAAITAFMISCSDNGSSKTESTSDSTKMGSAGTDTSMNS